MLEPLIGRLGFELELVELEPGRRSRTTATRSSAFEVAHSVRAYGYALVEDERPGRFDPEAARGSACPKARPSPPCSAGDGRGQRGAVAPEQVMGERARGAHDRRSPATPRPAPATVAAAADAELLIHDASFAEEEAQRAAETGHSTVGQAAAVAAEAHVKMLALVHISSRYHVGKVLEEAARSSSRRVAPRDFDVVEIPFPERGEPQLVPNGARSTAGRGRPLDGASPSFATARGLPRPAAPAATVRAVL